MDKRQKSICAALSEALKTAPGVTFEDDRDRDVAAGYLAGAVCEALEASGGYAPEGYWIAPDEPTKAMIIAGQDEHENCIDNDWDSGPDGESHNSYTIIASDAPARVYHAMRNVHTNRKG